MNDAPPNRLTGQPGTLCCRIEFYQLYGLRGWGSKFGPSCAATASGEAATPPAATVVVAECVPAAVHAASQDPPRAGRDA